MAGEKPFPYSAADSAIALSVEARANGFIADNVAPRKGVKKLEFKYTEMDLDTELQQVDDTVSKKSGFNEVEFSGTEHQDKVVDRGLQHTYSQDDVDNMTGNNPLGSRIKRLTNVVLRNREARICSMLADTNNYHAKYIETMTKGNQIGDNAIKVIDLFEDARNSMLVPGNQATASALVWSKIRRSADVVKAFNGTLGADGMVPLEWLTQYLGLDKINVGRAKANTAAKGLSAQVDNVWTSDFLSIQYINPNAELNEDVTHILTAQYKERVAGRKHIDMGLRGGWLIRSGESVKEVLISKHCGYLIKNPVALN